jgi:hypothetical protein
MIARLLWQRLLDKTTSFSSGNMRHLVWDESYEQFRICHFLACKSLPSAEMIMKRAQALKTLALDSHDLVRVRDCWYQPGEGAAGYGFVTLIMMDYIGNPRTTNTVEHRIARNKAAATIPEMTALKWGRSVANGLQHMHSLNLIHGNIKPSNVFLNDLGDACLGDYPFPKSTAPQPLMKKFGVCTDIFEFGLFLYYVCTGGACIPMDEYDECQMNEFTMLKLIPVRFGETLKHILSLALYHSDDISIKQIKDILHLRIRQLEQITELHNSRVLLLDNALNVIDDSNDGFILKTDLAHAIAHNSTVRAILSQDVELALLIKNPRKVGKFIMKMSTKRGDSSMTLVEADDILKLVKQMMITKRRDEEETQRIREEELRIAQAEAELEKKTQRQ